MSKLLSQEQFKLEIRKIYGIWIPKNIELEIVYKDDFYNDIAYMHIFRYKIYHKKEPIFGEHTYYVLPSEIIFNENIETWNDEYHIVTFLIKESNEYERKTSRGIIKKYWNISK